MHVCELKYRTKVLINQLKHNFDLNTEPNKTKDNCQISSFIERITKSNVLPQWVYLCPLNGNLETKKLATYFNMRFDSKVSTSEIKQIFTEEAYISKKNDIYTFNKIEHLALSCLRLLANLFHLQMFFLVIDSFLLQ